MSSKCKQVVGLVEKIKIVGNDKAIETLALMDTGAIRTSIDMSLAAEAKLGPIVGIEKIKQSSTKRSTKRPIVEAIIELKGKRFKKKVNLQDRSHMRYLAIIGRDILKGNFIVDPEKG
ncbi:MAG TPA: hypothetical protein ENG42_03070 [Candidatus Aenigmarchaeota archaeon]|nr:MAG: hypothetical protein DRP03_00335 [Candidatus Aenigmarchaeota archaeon]HDD46432.1 hypothetical protein [Candidatus Aenigmarchaeota archaeon]